MNNVIVVGNLARDLEVKFTSTGTAFVKGTVANNVKRGESEKTNWVPFTIWGDAAENAAASYSRGDRVIIVGQLESSSWEDQSGNKRSALDVRVTSIGPDTTWATVEGIEKSNKGNRSNGGGNRNSSSNNSASQVEEDPFQGSDEEDPF